MPYPAYLHKPAIARPESSPMTRSWLLACLLTHPCVDCSAADPAVLEFDHRSTETTTAAVAVLARFGYPLQRMQRDGRAV
ncbi:hypothetical protein [Blastococcus brunescens]|uniref:Uncharacterized protein n=1 Tax=Blastococcus brunescens TaxID=1564165 RepID=A0ABZ1B0P1_9ACTN|nr:hypothetical protein [Blastococcus sp. BMG 8361]WRL64374.1 hypothetical protein U6N30_00455 [Blastococcus sp. BMG 8361]